MNLPKETIMASVADAKYLTLAEACRLIPGRPHRNTVGRWITHGYAGIILKSWRCAGKRVTTVQAIDEFLAATTGVKDPNPRRSASIAHQRAEAQLDAMGV
jgi:uncharacterized protein DUF1580